MKSGYLLSTLLATVGALSACAMDGAEPELGTAEVDRGLWESYCPGPAANCVFEIHPGISVGLRTVAESDGGYAFMTFETAGRPPGSSLYFETTVTATCVNGRSFTESASGLLLEDAYDVALVWCPLAVSEARAITHLDF